MWRAFWTQHQIRIVCVGTQNPSEGWIAGGGIFQDFEPWGPICLCFRVVARTAGPMLGDLDVWEECAFDQFQCSRNRRTCINLRRLVWGRPQSASAYLRLTQRHCTSGCCWRGRLLKRRQCRVNGACGCNSYSAQERINSKGKIIAIWYPTNTILIKICHILNICWTLNIMC